jgi:hypothetical protein
MLWSSLESKGGDEAEISVLLNTASQTRNVYEYMHEIIHRNRPNLKIN